MKAYHIAFIISAITYFLTPILGTHNIKEIVCRDENHTEINKQNTKNMLNNKTFYLTNSLESCKIIEILPEVCIHKHTFEMVTYDTTNIMENNKKLKQCAIVKHICPLLTAQDLNHCIFVSKNFNKCITTYLETYTPYFGLIDFTKQLEKYIPEIEQIGDKEKNIIVQNPNPNETKDIQFDIIREHFYFPFTLEFSRIPISMNINNRTICHGIINNKVGMKITFSPRTKNILYQLFGSINFESISTIKFKLNPSVQDNENSIVSFKYKMEEQESVNRYIKEIKCKKRFLNAIVLLIFCAYLVWLPILLLYPR